MKETRAFPLAGSCLVAALAFNASTAQGIPFTVTIDTSPLIGQASGPFSLDLQFTDGSGLGDANNTVTLSGFNFNGGAWAGAATIQGGATAATGVITLTDRSFFNEVFQGFTPGASLSFSVALTGNLDVGSTPDQFSVGILDGGQAEIPTLGAGDALLSVDLNSTDPAVQRFATDAGRTPINIPSPQLGVAVVPESGVPGMIIWGVWGALLGWRRKPSRALARRG